MKTRIVSIPCLVLFMSVAVINSAYSWGPEAHKSIALSAYQILQYDIYKIAKAGDVSYEVDLIRGAMDGRSVIEESLPIHSDAQAIDAIGAEIELLRAAREHGIGSHFAYRLGVLAALVADVMHPYGIAYTPEEEKLKEMIDVDIEESIYSQNVTIMDRRNDFVTSMGQYVKTKRPFFADDQVLIRDDYRRGINFKGYAGQATAHYYERAVEAVVDVWYTIMSPKVNPRSVTPSDRAMTW